MHEWNFFFPINNQINEVFYPKPALSELTFQIIKNHTSILTTSIFIINNLSLVFLS